MDGRGPTEEGGVVRGHWGAALTEHRRREGLAPVGFVFQTSGEDQNGLQVLEALTWLRVLGVRRGRGNVHDDRRCLGEVRPDGGHLDGDPPQGVPQEQRNRKHREDRTTVRVGVRP